MESVIIQGWSSYQLLDSGDQEKLEQFGNYILRRPEPQALWKKALPEGKWRDLPHATYMRKKGNTDGETGVWEVLKPLKEPWWINLTLEDLPEFRFKLGLTSFKHVGLFPEQIHNWVYIQQQIHRLKAYFPGETIRILNLFAYTGAASCVAKAAGADIVHLDSVKPVVNWAKENMGASGLDGIRWIIEDALKFVKLEAKRGRKYHGIILDPPAFGRGPAGEKWDLPKDLPPMLEYCSEILNQEHSFLVMNLYSMGYSAEIAANLLRSYFDLKDATLNYGELIMPSYHGQNLPLGVYARFEK
jgi:23S rRNA (cytosine1962-C5)-methyltransferase